MDLDIKISKVYTLDMQKTMISIKMDRDIKTKAQRLAKELGLPLSTLINAYLKDFIRNPEVILSLKPKAEKTLKNASLNYKKGKSIVGPFSTSEQMDAYLNR